jgi:uncharacterized protein
MSKVLILGATGSLGRYVTQQAIAANHEVSALVRTPSKLPIEVREQVVVHQADLAATSAADLAAILQGHDAVINAAGLVSEGQGFVDLVGRVVWFLAGAALLELDDRGRRGRRSPPHRRHVLAAPNQL